NTEKDSQNFAYDEQGRRRFHGAFTGGFSAGYFNSVGSKEGWAPKQFFSSKMKRSEKLVTLPEQYMDEEDFSEFGIAPKQFHLDGKYSKLTHSSNNKEIKDIKETLNEALILKSSDIGKKLLRLCGFDDIFENNSNYKGILTKNSR
ncbi:MAG: G patch domain-containing protein 1, partial [Paramarteilia canceri]